MSINIVPVVVLFEFCAIRELLLTLRSDISGYTRILNLAQDIATLIILLHVQTKITTECYTVSCIFLGKGTPDIDMEISSIALNLFYGTCEWAIVAVALQIGTCVYNIYTEDYRRTIAWNVLFYALLMFVAYYMCIIVVNALYKYDFVILEPWSTTSTRTKIDVFSTTRPFTLLNTTD